MMNPTLCLLAILSLCCRSAEPRPITQTRPIVEVKPILVIMEDDPWESVIAWNSPTFVLCDDGTIVYRRHRPTLDEPFHSRTVLDPTEVSKVLLAFDPGEMRPRYLISDASDQTTTVIWTPGKTVEVYGNWRKRPKIDSVLLGMEDDPDTTWKAEVEMERRVWASDIKIWESLPKEIRAALLRIDRERSLEGTAWLPPTIEVKFSPFELAQEESIIWPEEWPGLHAKETRKGSNNTFTTILPSGKLAELRSFLSTRKAYGAVLVNGQKMSVSIRFPFPSEEVWHDR